MKRTNHFSINSKTNINKYAIASLSISSSGIAVAVDYSNEIRLYDIWHGEKISKLNA